MRIAPGRVPAHEATRLAVVRPVRLPYLRVRVRVTVRVRVRVRVQG